MTRGFIRCRGIKFRDEDDAHEYFRQREVDDQAALIEAGNLGRKAGMLGHGASLNPFAEGTQEHAEWDKHRLATIGAQLASKAA